ncbi:MAG: hypothetical protein OXC91_03250 [Rhodobacteraceae bacterium]|nr:hypothetical protein [Paracoccaceae bacterium]
MSLDQLLDYFKENQEDFARDHYGKYVVIHNQSVEGFYDNQLDAFTEAKERFRPGDFLIRQCIRPDEETVAVFHSRAA